MGLGTHPRPLARPCDCHPISPADVRLEFSAGYSLLHAAAFLGAATLIQLLLLLAGASRAADIDEGGWVKANWVQACHLARAGGGAGCTCLQRRRNMMPWRTALPSPPAHTTGGRTPAYLAASQGHIPALLLLLEAAPHTAAQPATINHWCPLIVAAKYGRAEAVRLLLPRAPGSATVASLNGRTAAHLAAERNQAEALQLLLAAAPGLAHAVSLLTGSTPLHSAARHGATDALQLLLAAAPGMADAADLAGAAAADQARELRCLCARVC